MASYNFEPTVLYGCTQQAKLHVTPDGYYDIIVGAFNTFNSAGAWYDLESGVKALSSSEHFMRRVRDKRMYGEQGHPVRTPGMSDAEWMIRILTIDPKSVSHFIRDLTIENDTFKNDDGTPMAVIWARLKPHGPYGEALGRSLDDPDQNTAFSIRSVTNDYWDPRRNCVVKVMDNPVTFDYVIEPGIRIAEKLQTPAKRPSLESLGMSTFSEGDLREAIRLTKSSAGSMENADDVRITLESMLNQRRDRERNRAPFNHSMIVKPTWSGWV